jgi:hypothetical protein
VANLQRISTQYRGAEDRLLLTGEFPSGSTVSLWLTQRLMLRAVPLLVDWLQKQTPTDLKARDNIAQAQEIAQTFSRPAVQVRKATPVSVTAVSSGEQPAVPENLEALVHSIDLTVNDKAVRLRFKGADGELGMVILNPQQLRQWLAVLQVLWRKADWQGEIWPSWLKSDAELASTRAKGAFH